MAVFLSRGGNGGGGGGFREKRLPGKVDMRGFPWSQVEIIGHGFI